MSYDVDGAAGTELITIQEKNGSEESKSSTLLRFTPVMLVNHEKIVWRNVSLGSVGFGPPHRLFSGRDRSCFHSRIDS